MANLYTRIATDMRNELKTGNRDKLNELRFIIGRLDSNTKLLKPIPTTDENVLAFLSSLHKDLSNTLVHAKTDDDKDKLNTSISVIESYMPKQLTESEIDNICATQSLTVMKDAMAYFKEHHFKQYDARYLSSKFK